MHQYDNCKLIGFLKEHGVEVISCEPHTITVNAEYWQDGKSQSEPETIKASILAIKHFLGY